MPELDIFSAYLRASAVSFLFEFTPRIFEPCAHAFELPLTKRY
jgi:hypothetical protein